MIKGAVAFSPLLRRWLGPDLDKVPVSKPYYYAVRRDSMVPVAEIDAHLRACNAIIREEPDGPVEYFGHDYRRAPERLRTYEHIYNGENIVAAYSTSEIAIDTWALADLIGTKLSANPKINCIMQATVLGVTPRAKAADVSFTRSGDTFCERYDHVINATWDSLLAIDATAGIQPMRPWLFRIKHSVRAYCRERGVALPSTTMVLGRYGDIVDYTNGSFYLSWYPAAMTQMTKALTAPSERDLDSRGEKKMFEAIQRGLWDNVVAMEAFARHVEDYHVSGGVIFTWGETDIDDPGSRLHERSSIGPMSYGHYHSINTGKMTMAPLFGQMMADHIRASHAG